MKQITWSTANLTGETPKSVKMFYRILMLLSSAWGFASVGNMLPGIPEHVALMVNNWLLIGNFAFYNFCQMFGYAEKTEQ